MVASTQENIVSAEPSSSFVLQSPMLQQFSRHILFILVPRKERDHVEESMCHLQDSAFQISWPRRICRDEAETMIPTEPRGLFRSFLWRPAGTLAERARSHLAQRVLLLGIPPRCELSHPGKPIRRISSSKRGSERRGSKPGRSRTPGLNRSS